MCKKTRSKEKPHSVIRVLNINSVFAYIINDYLDEKRNKPNVTVDSHLLSPEGHNPRVALKIE